MKVGQISYVNTLPFFQYWPEELFPLHSGTPRDLAILALKGEILAAPLPLVECWRMASSFEPLGNWGIAVKKESRSVFVLSKSPFFDLDQETLSVTEESSTSVSLCRVLIEKKYNHSVQLKRGLGPHDTAQLIIGDEALKVWAQSSQRWPYVTDLAEEWNHWKNLPFVFARWVVRKDLSKDDRQKLEDEIQKSLSLGIQNLPLLTSQAAQKLNLSSQILETYLKGFVFQLGQKEEEAMALFQQLYKETVHTHESLHTTHH